MVRDLLDKTICPACLALGYEACDLGSSPSWANIFLLYLQTFNNGTFFFYLENH